MPIYNVNGKTYNIPDSLVDKFEKDMPDASIRYENEGKLYDIPLSKKDGFTKAFPNAHFYGTEPVQQQDVYPQAVVDAHNSPNNVAPHYKDISTINREYQQTQKAKADVQAEEAAKVGQFGNGNMVSTPNGMMPDLRSAGRRVRAQQQSRNIKPLEEPQLYVAQQDSAIPMNADIVPDSAKPEDNTAKKEATAMQVSDMMGRVDQLINEAKSTVTESAAQAMQNDPMGTARMAMVDGLSFNQLGTAVSPQARAAQTQVHQLETIKRSLQDSQNIIDEANHNAQRGLESTFVAGAVRGAGQKLFDTRTWDMGIRDMEDQAELSNALQAFDEGKQLTEVQQMLLDAKALELATNAYFGSEVGRGYKAGQVTAEAIPFMLEMAINPASGIGKTLGSRLTRYALKRFSKQAAKKALTKTLGAAGQVAGDIAGSAAMTATTGNIRTAADAMRRMNGNIQFDTDESGKSVFAGHTTGEDALPAFAKAFASTTIENHSEMVGEYFSPLLGLAGGTLKKGFGKAAASDIGKAIRLDKVGDFMNNVATSDVARLVNDFEKNAKWSGTFAEFAEEIIGGVENALIVGDQTLDADEQTGVFNTDNMIDTFLGVSLMGGFMSAAKTFGYQDKDDRLLNNYLQASKTPDSFKDDESGWETLRNNAFAVEGDELKAYMRAVLDEESMNWNQKRDFINMIKAQQEYRGEQTFKAKEELDNETSETDQLTPEQRAVNEAEESRMAGYDTTEPEAMNEAKNDYEAALADMEGSFSPETIAAIDANPTEELRLTYMNPSYSDVDRQHVLDYVNAKQRYDGMVQRVRDDIDGMIQASDAEIDSQVNTGTGMVQPATLKVDNRQVHIIDGNVALLEDGSIDTANSTRDIIVRDAQTGKVEFVSPSAFLGVDEAMDPAALKQQAAENIRQTKAQQAADQIDGVLPFQQGDTYDGVDAEGQPVQVQIISDNGDGTVNVGINGEAAGVPMQKEAVQQLVDNARRAQAVARREDAASQRAKNTNLSEPSRNMTEGRDAYSLNEEIGVTLPDGSIGSAVINAEQNADGQYEVELRDEAGNPVGVQLLTADQLNAMQPAEAQAEAGQQSAPTKEAVSSDLNGEQEQPAEQAAETPSAEATLEVVPQNDTTDAMPMIGEGEDMGPDFAHATPQRTQQYLYEESGLEQDEADDFVKDMKKRAQTEKTKLEGKKPKLSDRGIDNKIPRFQRAKAEWQGKVDEAQRKVDYWNSVEQEQQMKQRQAAAAVAAENAARQAAQTEQAIKEEEARKAKEAAKAAEQEAVGANNVNPAIREKWNAAPKVEGNSDEMVLANGERIPGRYVLVESGAASASHNALNGFLPTEGFPVDENGQSVNDRDYERDTNAQDITRRIADSYDQRALQTPVVVSGDGVVLSGNGRTMAGELAAVQNTDQAYTDYLRSHPERFGFTSEQVSQMQHPRVVFVPDGQMPYTAETFGKFNQQEMKGQSKSEQAVKLGKVVDDQTFGRILRGINRFDSLGAYYNDTAAATEAVRDLQRAGAISEAQLPQMFDGDTLSPQGREILENTLIGKAFEGNPDAVRMITAYKGMRQSVVTALSEIANNVALGEDYSLQNELANAIALVYEARNKGGFKAGERVSSFAMQGNLFQLDEGATVADFESATVLMLADVLNDNRSTQLKKIMVLYNQHAAESASGQMDIFSGGVQNKEDIINFVRNIVNNGTEAEQQAALDQAREQRKQEAAGNEESIPAGESREGGEVSIAPSDQLKPTDLRESVKPDEAKLKPIGRGAFGNIYDQFKGKVKEALDFLLKYKSGDLLGVFHRDGFGDIDLVWGSKDEEKGLDHIIDKHVNKLKDFASAEEAISVIDDVIKNGRIVKDKWDKATFEKDDYRVVVRKNIRDDNGQIVDNDKRWVVTAFDNSKTEKEKATSVTTRATPDNTSGSRAVTPDVASSESKDSTSSDNNQENQQENEEQIEKELESRIEVQDLPTWPETATENGIEYHERVVVDGKHNVLKVDAPDEKGNYTGSYYLYEGKRFGSIVEVVDYIDGKQSVQQQIEAARNEVAQNPTEAQKEAGNYKKGHIKLDGYDISIENPKGSTRSGVDEQGKEWSVTMNNDYGYLRGTEGVDGDHIDVFLSDNPTEDNVFVVDQVKPDGSFDEHKVMYGFATADEARAAYLANYSPGWTGLGAITEVSKDEFKKWVESSHRKTKPFAEYKSVKPISGQNEGNTSYSNIVALSRESSRLWKEYFDLPSESEVPEEQKKDARKRQDEASSKWIESINRLRAAISRLSDEEIAGIEDALGEEYGYVSRYVEEIQKNREVQHTLTQVFEDGIMAQGEVTGKDNGKDAKPEDYTKDNEEQRPVLHGTFHDPEGYAVVTNARVLLADKKGFEKSHEGKVVAHREIAGNKKGDVIEGNFPKWKNVIKPVEDHKDATLDAAKLLDFIAGAEERMKSQWKQEKDNGQTKQSFSNWSADADLVARMPDGTVIGFNFNNLRLFAKGVRQIGADSVEYTDRDKGIAARSDSGVVTVMPKLIEGEGNEGRRFFYDMSEIEPKQPIEKKDNTPFDNTKENGDLFAEAETDASESQPTDKPLVGKALDKAIRHAREELRQARAKLSMANALNSPYTEEERKEKAAEVEKWEKELERLTGMKKEAPTASASVRASTPNKIEDFGEKIGGARKDVARGRIRDTKQLSVKDLTTLKKGADDILSQANILRLYREGQMDEQTARSFMAFNNVVKLTLKKGYGNKDIVLGKYRDAAVAWEEGKPFSFEITEQDVKDRMAMFARATEEGVRQDLEYAIKEPYDDFMQTYEALNYPAEERKLGNYVIKDYTKSKHVVSKISYPFWVKNGYRAQRGYPFRTLADAVTKIKNLCPLVEAKDKNGKSKGESTGHGLHVAKDGSFYYVKSRNIPGTIYLSRKFFNERDAKKFLEDNLEKLKEREQRMVDALMGSSIGMAEREGVDYRGGRDVTPQDFLDEFGFRGVEFGNWVPQAERQLYLNKTYDAIEDLCAIIGISPKAFSLGGRLGLAFGARGHGRAMAHYESGKEVINLTRMSGTGSLAHEWFHALDNYLARQKSGNVSDFATETHDTVRTEVGRAFSALYDKMRSLDYHRRSQRAGREYWGKTVEEFARLFENYIYNKLAERQTISPVLVREDTLLDQIEDEYTRNAWPYPSRAENEEMKPLFDSLFETIQEETDGNGNIVLFQKVDGSEMKRDADAAETALRDALIDTMREAGIDVITDAEAGQQVLDMANEEATLSRDKKRASESVSVSSEEEHLQAVDSDAGTKIIHNLENLAKNIENIKQSPIKTFLGEVARAIGARKQGSNSQYATFETKNGQIVTIRLADHNAHTSGFDNSGRNNGISIVVSPKKNNGVNNDGKAHVVEYYYDAIKLRRAEGKPLAQIVRSIQQALYSGEYKDTTGLAKREEVNPDGTQEIMGKVQFFRTSNGDAYGFTVNGKIYIDPRIATAETPIHEYGHLWTAALRKANPAAWERLKEQLLGQKDVVDYVKSLYPELNGDALMDEIFQHYAGKRGAERLRSELQRLLAENKADGGKIRAMFETIRKALDYFWNMARDLFTGNNANLKRITAENFADMMLADLLNGYKPELNASNEMRELRRDSERRIQREETNHVVDEAISAITGKDIKEVRRERMNREEQRRREAKEIYQNVLSGNFNDVTLQQINDYINDVTPNNPYGRRLSERLPQRVGRRVESEKGISAVDALFSRISESSVRPNERTRSEGRRKIEEQKKELLKLWAQATGHWHTDLSAFTDDIEPIGSGTDSDVYSSKDGRYVIKASKGKPIGKRFRPDIDNIPLFNSLFPHMAYEILGYGEIDGNFVRILRQPAVDFENSEPLTEAERVGFMGSLGFYPINKGNTSFSNGEIIVADLQKSNVVRDSDGIIQVIDADVRLHTKDMGGNYDYLPVEHDLPMQSDAKENGEEAAVFFQVSEDDIQRRSQAQKVATNAVLQALQNARVPVQTVSDKEALQMLLLSMNGTDWKRVRDAAEAGRRYGQQRYYVVNLEDPTHINEAFYYETKDAAQKDAAYYNRLGWGSFVMLDLDSEKNVASEVENPERLAAQIEFLKVKGKVYGWTDGKTIYLTKRGMNPNTTIHEYTHLWAASLQRTNPELWAQVKDLLRDTQVWADVIADTNYKNIWTNEDAIASEALSRISGRENGNYLDRLSERAVKEHSAIDATSIIDRVRRALDFFWNWVGTHIFGMNEFRNISQVTDRILYDLMSGELLTYEQGEEMAFNVNGETYSDEEKRIIDEAKANGTYMKALNGKPSNLNPKQWAQVRTKAFKKWFGDWELPLMQFNITPAEAQHGFSSRDDAETWGKQNIVRTYDNDETGGKGKIKITSNTISKFCSDSAIRKSESRDVHFAVLKVLPSVIKDGHIIEEHPDYKKGTDGKRSPENGIVNDSTIYRLFGAVNVNDKVYRVKITLKNNATDGQGTRAYSYEATKIELLDGQSEQAETSSRNSNNSITCAKLLKGVEKSYGNGEKLLDSSKVVDENGEPLVVYHRTPMEFTVFKDEHSRGIWFTSDREVADGLAGNRTLGVFLNVRNIKSVDFEGKDYLRNQSVEEYLNNPDDISSDGEVNKARSENFDGVRLKDIKETDASDKTADVFIVFEANQIKSATENKGTFDNSNDDIRFREIYRKNSEIAYNFARNNKGVGRVAVITAENGYNILRQRGIDADKARKYMEDFKSGIRGLCLYENDLIIAFDNGNVSEEKINSYLWHEAGHRAIYYYNIPREWINEFAEYTKADNPEFYEDIQKLYSDNSETVRNEELLTFMLEGLFQFSDKEINEGLETFYNSEIPALQHFAEIIDIIRYGTEERNNRLLQETPSVGQKPQALEVRNDNGAGRERSQEEAAIEQEVNRLADKLGVSATIVHSASELPESESEARKRINEGRMVKGWYNNGRIYVYVPNTEDAADAKRTMVHEIVAHYGLRKLLGKRFKDFMLEVYEHADQPIRKQIERLAARYDWDFVTATEEYLASLAENTNFDEAKRSGWWARIKQAFYRILEDMGFGRLNGKLTDNELRYLLWRSYDNLERERENRQRDIFDEAADTAMQYELGVGDYMEPTETSRFRITTRDKATVRTEYEKMIQSGTFQFREAVQDSMRGLHALYKAVLGDEFTTIENVPGYENAYLAENRMSSQSAAEQHDYFNRYMQPLLKAISKIAGKDEAKRTALTNYMMAKHGLERNMVLADRDARIAQQGGGDYDQALQKNRERDYAGLTALTGEADLGAAEIMAQQMVDDFENTHDAADIQAVWDAVKEASHATLEKLYKSGLMSGDAYQNTLGMFQNYIPLRGWEETTSDEVYGYLTSNDSPLLGSVLKTAKGRSSKADDPIAYIAQMADKAIMEGNRNRMKQTFMNFVLNHPSDLVSVSDIWMQYDDLNDEWVAVFPELNPDDTAEEVEQKLIDFENDMQQLSIAYPDHYKRSREHPEIPYRVKKGNLREHQVLVKRNGKTTVLTINGNPRAAQALNGLTNPDVEVKGAVGNLLKMGEYVNRQLSAFYTTRNPDFVVSNFLRDMVYSNVMTWVKENPAYALRFHKNVGKVNPAMMRKLLGKWESGTLNDSNYTEMMFKQFMLNGGETGYTSVRDIEQHKQDIAKELRKQGSTGRKAWDALGMQMDLLNRSVENCARFAAFVTSREMGRNVERSIYDAKEVSVNFNKKGSGGKMVNTVGQTKLGKLGGYVSGLGRVGYVFWNAGVQGMTNFGRAGKRHQKKFIAAAASVFSLGVIVPLLAQLLSDGDDDDKNAYYNLAEYIRRSNIVFYAGDQWITIPLPIELRALYGLGELATGVVTGMERYSDQEMAFQIASQLSQILPLDMLEGGGGLTPFLPSSAKPYVEAYWLNKRWTGLPVFKDTPYNKTDPEWKKAYSSTDKTLVAFTRWLNELGGGDDFKKSEWPFMDINPAKIEYLLSGTFGGYASTIEKLKKMGETAVGERDFEWRNMLLANRVVQSGDETTEYRKLQNEFYRYKAEADETKRLYNRYQKAQEEGEEADAQKYAEKQEQLLGSDEYRRYEIFQEYKDDINSYDEMMADASDKDEEAMYKQMKFEVIREMVEEMRKGE